MRAYLTFCILHFQVSTNSIFGGVPLFVSSFRVLLCFFTFFSSSFFFFLPCCLISVVTVHQALGMKSIFFYCFKVDDIFL